MNVLLVYIITMVCWFLALPRIADALSSLRLQQAHNFLGQ